MKPNNRGICNGEKCPFFAFNGREGKESKSYRRLKKPYEQSASKEKKENRKGIKKKKTKTTGRRKKEKSKERPTYYLSFKGQRTPIVSGKGSAGDMPIEGNATARERTQKRWGRGGKNI